MSVRVRPFAPFVDRQIIPRDTLNKMPETWFWRVPIASRMCPDRSQRGRFKVHQFLESEGFGKPSRL